MSEAASARRRAASLEAAEWYERLASAPEAAGVREEFLRWLDADPRNAAEFEAVEQAMRIARAAADAEPMRALRRETAQRLSRPRRPTFAYALAASLAVFVAVAVLVGWRAHQTTLEAPAIYETAAGERSTITLADGSTVVLNTRSRVRAVYTERERRLYLDAGEAVFEVAKDRARPFTVTAGGQVITAHGTAFNVRLDPGQVDVALFEGSIVVKPHAASEAAGTRVEPGQRLTVAAGQARLSEIRKVEQVASWRRGIVFFEDATLAEAVAEMNRYGSRPIRIADPALDRLRLSGSFRTDGAGAFVEALELYFPLQAVYEPDASVVLTSRSGRDGAAAD